MEVVSTEASTSVSSRAATRRELRREVNEGHFRSDLLFRVAQVMIELPPLRRRMADIRLLAQRIFAELGDGDAIGRCTDDFLAQLQRHDWPGNVRELRSALNVALAFSHGGKIETLPKLMALSELSSTARVSSDRTAAEIEQDIVAPGLARLLRAAFQRDGRQHYRDRAPLRDHAADGASPAYGCTGIWRGGTTRGRPRVRDVEFESHAYPRRASRPDGRWRMPSGSRGFSVPARWARCSRPSTSTTGAWPGQVPQRPLLRTIPRCAGAFSVRCASRSVIESEHVARLVMAGEHDGRPWIAFEFLDGEPLHARLRRDGALRAVDAKWIVEHVLQGLDAAYASARHSPRHQACEHLPRVGSRARARTRLRHFEDREPRLRVDDVESHGGRHDARDAGVHEPRAAPKRSWMSTHEPTSTPRLSWRSARSPASYRSRGERGWRSSRSSTNARRSRSPPRRASSGPRRSKRSFVRVSRPTLRCGRRPRRRRSFGGELSTLERASTASPTSRRAPRTDGPSTTRPKWLRPRSTRPTADPAAAQ